MKTTFVKKDGCIEPQMIVIKDPFPDRFATITFDERDEFFREEAQKLETVLYRALPMPVYEYLQITMKRRLRK